MAEEIILTREGFKKLEEELNHLKNVRRREVAKRIKHAREFGDISENSEYDEAKNEQAFVEGRIREIEHLLRKARIAEEESEADVVSVGKTVTLKDLDNNEEITYSIVGSVESDPLNYKISNESPLGKAIIGKKVGDIVEFDAPIGRVRYRIMALKK
ncbi:transcription elongation factor GreA [Anoxybacter fermentans]|uniref:Transcription elongation factor GreA n=1 Tax=Anoxybacter fermentans TaxID=1323375 RepID=A0A3Q9HSJ9_9FIRM|nr:transcription elongation factor GreA [Anoxybacter fermentans]AZR74675.1 transcription elongation factor GreA [Anoxybacter fermentans]